MRISRWGVEDAEATRQSQFPSEAQKSIELQIWHKWSQIHGERLLPVHAPSQVYNSHSYHDEEFEAWPINFINQASADILIYSH